MQVTATVERMLQSGMLVSSAPDSEFDMPACAASRSEAKTITFAAALLAPLLATYADVLTHATDVLQRSGPLPRAELEVQVLAALKVAVATRPFGYAFAAQAAARGGGVCVSASVPSCLLVANALKGWTTAGVLVVENGASSTSRYLRALPYMHVWHHWPDEVASAV